MNGFVTLASEKTSSPLRAAPEVPDQTPLPRTATAACAAVAPAERAPRRSARSSARRTCAAGVVWAGRGAAVGAAACGVGVAVGLEAGPPPSPAYWPGHPRAAAPPRP